MMKVDEQGGTLFIHLGFVSAVPSQIIYQPCTQRFLFVVNRQTKKYRIMP